MPSIDVEWRNQKVEEGLRLMQAMHRENDPLATDPAAMLYKDMYPDYSLDRCLRCSPTKTIWITI